MNRTPYRAAFCLLLSALLMPERPVAATVPEVPTAALCEPGNDADYCLRVQVHIRATTATVWSLVQTIEHMPLFFPDFAYVSTDHTLFAPGVTYTVTWLPANATGIYRVDAVEPGRRMAGHQVRGPLRSFRYDHRFLPTTDGTISDETITYSLPYGLLGRVVHFFVVRRRLRRTLLDAHRRLKLIAEQAESASPRGESGTVP